MPRHSLTWGVLHFAVGEWTSIAAIGILCSTSTPPASAGVSRLRKKRSFARDYCRRAIRLSSSLRRSGPA